LLGHFLIAPAAAAVLDGKSFVSETGEKGKPMSEKDEIAFAAGQFHSKACDPWGFAKAPYKASTKAGVTSFEAETSSPKEGKIHWTGTVKGDTLEGRYVWTKAGQAPIEYWVKGTLKK
jgi:hypothetical protein